MSVNLRPPSWWHKRSNSDRSTQGMRLWISPMQSCRLRSISTFPPAAVHPSEDKLEHKSGTVTKQWLQRWLCRNANPWHSASWAPSGLFGRHCARAANKVSSDLPPRSKELGSRFELSFHGSPAQASSLVTHLQHTWSLWGSPTLQQVPSSSLSDSFNSFLC